VRRLGILSAFKRLDGFKVSLKWALVIKFHAGNLLHCFPKFFATHNYFALSKRLSGFKQQMIGIKTLSLLRKIRYIKNQSLPRKFWSNRIKIQSDVKINLIDLHIRHQTAACSPKWLEFTARAHITIKISVYTTEKLLHEYEKLRIHTPPKSMHLVYKNISQRISLRLSPSLFLSPAHP
jgi:hypothetical protein